MRISDWSSDVCSSDLRNKRTIELDRQLFAVWLTVSRPLIFIFGKGGRHQEGFAELRLRRRALCIDLTIADAAVLHFAIFANDGVDVEGFKFRHFEPFRLSGGVRTEEGRVGKGGFIPFRSRG